VDLGARGRGAPAPRTRGDRLGHDARARGPVEGVPQGGTGGHRPRRAHRRLRPDPPRARRDPGREPRTSRGSRRQAPRRGAGARPAVRRGPRPAPAGAAGGATSFRNALGLFGASPSCS
jgi:hypothetical protein